MGNELDEEHEESSSGIHGAEGSLLRVILMVRCMSQPHFDALGSNTCWKW